MDELIVDDVVDPHTMTLSGSTFTVPARDILLRDDRRTNTDVVGDTRVESGVSREKVSIRRTDGIVPLHPYVAGSIFVHGIGRIDRHKAVQIPRIEGVEVFLHHVHTMLLLR
jgi:hypothetical protein